MAVQPSQQVGVAPACRTLGVPRASFYRRQRPAPGHFDVLASPRFASMKAGICAPSGTGSWPRTSRCESESAQFPATPPELVDTTRPIRNAIFGSRYVVGCKIGRSARRDADRGPSQARTQVLTLHSDRGAPMTSKCTAQLLTSGSPALESATTEALFEDITAAIAFFPLVQHRAPPCQSCDDPR